MIDGKDLFSGLFDFNGDGRTDFMEAALGCQILESMRREDEEDEYGYGFNHEDEDSDDN